MQCSKSTLIVTHGSGLANGHFRPRALVVCPPRNFLACCIPSLAIPLKAVNRHAWPPALTAASNRQPPCQVRRNRHIEIVPISTGCLGACTYCKTKHARGHLGSYDPAVLVERVRQAAADPWVSRARGWDWDSLTGNLVMSEMKRIKGGGEEGGS